LITSCFINICTKNYHNLIILVQVTVENVLDVFETVYILQMYAERLVFSDNYKSHGDIRRLQCVDGDKGACTYVSTARL